MKYLQGKRLYLSGAIEADNSNINWRTEPTRVLQERYGLQVFDPFEDPKQKKTSDLMKARRENDYETMANITRAIVKKDLALVDRSDLLIAHINPSIPTTGTHHEIINSVNAKKPVLLVGTGSKSLLPLWYYGFIPHRHMFSSWNELYIYLDEVDAGKHMDNDRWAFIYGLL